MTEPDEEIRPEIIQGVLQHNQLAAEYANRAEQIEVMRISALQQITTGTNVLRELGFPVGQLLPAEYVAHITRFVRSGDVADSSFVEAVSMWRQAISFDGAMRLLVSWWPQATDKTLGELLELVPKTVAAEVLGHLSRAGFSDLPDPEP